MPGYHLPLFAAAATGIWKRHGLDVELVDPEPGPANARAAAEGRYDACLTSVAHFLRAKAEQPGLAARFVFMVARRTHMAALVVDGRPAAHGRPIKTFEDLEGASSLGSSDKPFGLEYADLLDGLHLEPGRVVDIPYSEVQQALADGRGDVAPDYLDLLPTFDLVANVRRLRVRALPFYEAGVNVYGSGLVAGAHLIETRPEVLRRLTAALREALFVTREAPSTGLPALRARFAGTYDDHVLAGWRAGERLVFPDEDVGAIDRVTAQSTLEHHARVHGVSCPPVDAVFDDAFIPSPAAA